jgi:hypothetical protein
MPPTVSTLYPVPGETTFQLPNVVKFPDEATTSRLPSQPIESK